MLEAYFDDSGDSNLGVVAVGGFVATREAWSRLFETSWSRFLANNDLPYFRMAEYESRMGAYEGWSNPRRIAVMQEAQTLIARTARLGVGVAIDISAFERYRPEFERIIGASIKPFHVCAHFAVTVAEAWRDKRGEGKIRYIFEAGSEGEGAFLRTMRLLATTIPEGFHEDEPAYVASKGDHGQLHAADFLAYETYKAARRELGLDDLPDRKSLVAMLQRGGVEYNDLLLSDERFEWMLEVAQREEDEV